MAYYTCKHHTEVANVLILMICSTWMLFAGFLIPSSSIPLGWMWLYTVSYFRYALKFMLANEFEGLTFSCPEGRGVVPVLISSNVTECAGASFSDVNCFRLVCPITSADQFLSAFDIDTQNMWDSFGYLVACWFVWRVLAYLTLKYINFVKR